VTPGEPSVPAGRAGRNDGGEDTDALYAWLAKDPGGIEGLLAVPVDETITPLVSTNEALALRLEPLAREAGRVRDQPVRLVRFARDRTIITRPPAASN
jgi:hypothetical protein